MPRILMPCILTMIIPFVPLHTSQQNWSCWKRITYNDGIKKADLLNPGTVLIYPYNTSNACLISDDKTANACRITSNQTEIDHSHYWWKPLVHHKTNRILSNDTKDSAALWNFKGEKIHTYKTKRLLSVDFNTEGTSFAALIDQNSTESLITIRTIEGAIAAEYSVADKKFTSLYIHPHNENILYAHDDDNDSLYWIDRRVPKPALFTTDRIKQVSFNPTNMLIGAICVEPSILDEHRTRARIYEHPSRTGIGINLDECDTPKAVIFNSTGSHLLTTKYAPTYYPMSRIWNVNTIKETQRSRVNLRRVYAFDNVDTKYVKTLNNAECGHFSQDGNSIIAHYYDSTSDRQPQNTVDIYTLTGEKRSSFTHPNKIVAAYFDYLGNNILAHEGVYTVNIWKKSEHRKSTSDQPVVKVQA